MADKIKSILISQPKPSSEKSPYFDLAAKYKVKIDFRSFIHVEGIPAKEFRQERVNILEHTAIILTSRNAVDHFFRMCEEMRVNVPDSYEIFLSVRIYGVLSSEICDLSKAEDFSWQAKLSRTC